MFKHRFEENAGNWVVFHWFLLSFSGGAINAGGFLATGRFVSHVTGFATLFGVDLASWQWEAALGILSVPVFFLAGAFVAGLLVERPLHYGRKPHFDWVMSLSALCLLLAAAGEELLQAESFGTGLGLRHAYLLLILLCLACGLQNAAITSSSGRSIRTTHLTGLTTDLGLGLARVLTLKSLPRERQRELRFNYLRIGSILAFVFGSAVGAIVFVKLGYRGFIFPALISMYVAWQGRQGGRLQ